MSQRPQPLSPWFYCPELSGVPTDRVHLDKGESRHAVSVLRLGEGAEIELFDGAGTVARARITAADKRAVQAQLIEVVRTEPASYRHTLACAAPKGDRLRWLVEKSTELGIDRVVLLQTDRSVVEPGISKLDKLRQTAVAAAKQCRRARLPELERSAQWSKFLDSIDVETQLIVADPGGAPIAEAEQTCLNRSVVLAIGPEGGWTADELQSARDKGAVVVSLGSTILRIETAAIALVAWMRFLPGCEPDH